MTTVLDKKEIKINEKSLTEHFLELVRINSPSGQERALADYLKKKLREMGLEVYEDNAAAELKGDAGNIIGFLKGNQKGRPIMFCAHMDTVVDNSAVIPIVEKGIIKTDGSTILGGDDKGGITAILETIKLITDNNLPHSDMYIVFTVAEEVGLLGAKKLDLSSIKAEMGFILDSGGPAGTVIVTAPTQVDLIINMWGKSAHAGVNPEDGINAILTAANFLSHLTMGRLDEETTLNIGLIKGGTSTNIVPDFVELKGEIRSNNNDKIARKIRNIENLLAEICDQNKSRYELTQEKVYNAFSLSEKDYVVQIAKWAAEAVGIECRLLARGGGSDANIFNERGIPSVNLGVGTDQVHTNQEYINLNELANTINLLLAIIENTIS